MTPEEPPRRSRLKGLLLIAFGLLVIGAFVNIVSPPQKPRPSSEPAASVPAAKIAPRQHAPRLAVAIQRTHYEHGYFKVLGKIENVGSAEAFSPTIKLQVFDKTGKTLLAETSTWPAGQYLKAMMPGLAAAFEFSTRVPGDPAEVKWRVWVDRYDFEIVKPK